MSYVNYTVTNNIGIIEFYTPQHNSLPATILQKLQEAFIEADKEEDCKVIILKSSGYKTFCAGASFDELLNIKTEAEGLLFFSGFANVINAMRNCTKIVIGLVQGKAIGGGVGLACACDYTMATIDAQIKLSELAVGIGPFVVGPAVERKIGKSAAYELAIDATNFKDAQWAMQKGLFTHLHSSVESMNDAALQFANHLTTQSSAAMRDIKIAFWEGTEHWDTFLYERAAISGKLVLSPFTKNFLSTFKLKNK